MAQKASQRYSSQDKEEVKAAIGKSELWDQEEASLQHRIAMVSLNSSVNLAGSAASPIQIEESSGEDSVLGSSALPMESTAHDKDVPAGVQSMFSPTDNDPSPSATAHWRSDVPDLEESSGYLKVKQLFDSDSEDSALSAVATSIPTIPEPLGSDIPPMRRTRRRELSTDSSGEEIEVGAGISLTQQEVDRLLAEP